MTTELETMELLNVTADCKKKNCGLVKNSPECKLAHFSASCLSTALKRKEKTKDELIKQISRASETRYGDELIKFMDTYGLINLQQATRKQLEEYIANNLDKGVGLRCEK